MFKLLSIFVVACFSASNVWSVASVWAQEGLSETLLFSELKVRYDSNSSTDFDEYIELFNNSSSDLPLDGYMLEYFNVTNPLETQQPVQRAFSEKILGQKSYLLIAKQSAQIEFSVQSPFTSLSDTGGRLRLVTPEGEVIDEIVWTNSQAVANSIVTPPILYQCNTSTVLCTGNRSQSYSRTINPVLSAWQLGTSSPKADELLHPIVDPPPDNDPDIENPPPPDEEEPASTCLGIVISEVLPNPIGADTGNEFIELYNPTLDSILLQGCSLQIAGNSKVFALPEVSMGPSSYLALYDGTSTLTLPNAAGGTVWLQTATEELEAFTYPASLDDGAVWAVIDGLSGLTYFPTPNTVNVSMPLKPCEVGKIRNEITGDCQTPVSQAVSSLTPCKIGQERNPDTNRCRTVASVANAGLIPCKEGQERNPETNRCRAIAAVVLAACESGQVRSTDTNRCRKISSSDSNTLAAVTDVPSKNTPVGPAWWVIGSALIFALGYCIFEWRQDIITRISDIHGKLRAIK